MKIGKVIKELREGWRIPQGVLASAIGVSQTYLSLIESDKKIPSYDITEKLAIMLNVPVFYLYLAGMDQDDVPEESAVEFNLIHERLTAQIKDFFIDKIYK